MDRQLSEQQPYTIIQAALRTEGMDSLKLADLAGQTGFTLIGRKAHELAGEGNPVTDVDRGKAFWNLLERAIDGLKPADIKPDVGLPKWRPYYILYRAYCKGERNDWIAHKLNISETELLRQRRAAIRAVVRQLQQWESALREKSAANDGF